MHLFSQHPDQVPMWIAYNSGLFPAIKYPTFEVYCCALTFPLKVPCVLLFCSGDFFQWSFPSYKKICQFLVCGFLSKNIFCHNNLPLPCLLLSSRRVFQTLKGRLDPVFFFVLMMPDLEKINQLAPNSKNIGDHQNVDYQCLFQLCVSAHIRMPGLIYLFQMHHQRK